MYMYVHVCVLVAFCDVVCVQLSEAVSLEGQTESVVCVWTRESSHNYENNARVSEEFVCPSATKFVIEFDPRCLTERRYDYLEFTDVTGAKQKFDGKVNSDRWPRVRSSHLLSNEWLKPIPLYRLQCLLGKSYSLCSTQMAVIMNGATCLR